MKRPPGRVKGGLLGKGGMGEVPLPRSAATVTTPHSMGWRGLRHRHSGV